MPIKKSFLEKKLPYRIAKVFFLSLPLLPIILFLLGYINIQGITSKNILSVLQKHVVYNVYILLGLAAYYLILKGIWRIILYIAFGGLEDDTIKKAGEATQPVKPAAESVAPFIVLVVVFAIIALSQMGYIKLPQINPDSEESDTSGESSHTYGTPCTSDGEKGLYGKDGICYTCSEGTAVTNPINKNCSNGISGVYCCTTTSNGGTNNQGCIPTGCGSLWYCSGSYYIEGQRIDVPGLCFPRPAGEIYPSWSGTCRQCP